MTETLEPVANEVDQQQLAEQLLAQAREQGIDLVGPNGLLNQLTKNVLETALEAEMIEHLGYDKHDPAGRRSGNSRNGTLAKTVLTEIGPVEIEVPRNTDSSFDPQIVKKRQRRLGGIDEIVLSLTAKGLTTGEVAAHVNDVYGAKVSKDTISRITEKVVGEMTDASVAAAVDSCEDECQQHHVGHNAAACEQQPSDPGVITQPAHRTAPCTSLVRPFRRWVSACRLRTTSGAAAGGLGW